MDYFTPSWFCSNWSFPSKSFLSNLRRFGYSYFCHVKINRKFSFSLNILQFSDNTFEMNCCTLSCYMLFYIFALKPHLWRKFQSVDWVWKPCELAEKKCKSSLFTRMCLYEHEDQCAMFKAKHGLSMPMEYQSILLVMLTEVAQRLKRNARAGFQYISLENPCLF